MCGRDDPPSAPQIGAPPSLQDMMDVFDDVTGTRTMIVTGADGKKRRVNTVHRTPEEEARLQPAQELISSAINNMKSLFKYDPQSMVDFGDFINTIASVDADRLEQLGEVANIGNIRQDVADFKQMQRTLIDEEYRIKNRSNEETLAHNGLGNSTYAAESRAAMHNQQVMAQQQGDIQGSIYGEDIASKRLGRNKEAFSLQEIGREGRLDAEANKYGLYKADEADMEQRRQAAIAEQANLMNTGRNVVQDDLNRRLANQNVATAQGDYNAVNGAEMNRFNADVNRQNINYQNAMAEYNARPPSMMEGLIRTGTQFGAAYLGGMGRSHGQRQSGQNGMNKVGHMFMGKGIG